MRRGRPRHPDILTPREQQVLQLLRQNLTNAEIAVRLGISPDGVKYHVSEILSKLDVENRQQAVSWAEQAERPAPAFLAPLLRNAPVLKLVGATTTVVLAVVVLALLLGLFATDEPGPPALGKLAYIQDGNLWVRDLPNGKPLQLTGDGTAWYPRWSPSGEWLSEGYVTGTQTNGVPIFGVQVMRADGSERRHAPSCHSWSPTEDVLLCASGNLLRLETPEGIELRRINVEALVKAQRDLMWITNVHCYSWAPDGLKLACGVHGIATGATSDHTYSGLWTVNTDGGGARELFFNDVTADGGGYVIAGDWSRDSQAVIFRILPRSGSPCFLCTAGDGETMYVASLTGEMRPLPGKTLALGGIHGTIGLDGIRAVTEGSGRETWTHKRIALVDNAGALRYLSDADRASMSPARSQDRTQLAYVSAPDAGSLSLTDDGRAGPEVDAARVAKSQRRIWLVNADGSNQRQLTNDPAFRDERPLWSRDSTRIVFARIAAEGQASVWLQDVAGGPPQKLADVSRPRPVSTLRIPNTRDDYFDRTFDAFGWIPWSFLYSWWQPRS